MANITNTLIANITATEDTTQNVILNRTVPNLNFDSTTATGMEYIALANGDNVIAMPVTPVCQAYVRNNDAALDITVKITPNGGALVTTVKLKPGDVWFIWQKPGGAGAGITSLTLNASGAGALCEYFLGG